MTIFSFILLAMIVYRIFKWIWKEDKPEQKKPLAHQGEQVVEEMKQDPVCGTYVPASLAVTATHKGATVYFCSGACRDKFNENKKTG
jgi:YHS domain-containing protein